MIRLPTIGARDTKDVVVMKCTRVEPLCIRVMQVEVVSTPLG